MLSGLASLPCSQSSAVVKINIVARVTKKCLFFFSIIFQFLWLVICLLKCFIKNPNNISKAGLAVEEMKQKGRG